MQNALISKGNDVIRIDNTIVDKNMIDYDNYLSVYQKKFLFKLLISFKNGEDLTGIHWFEIAEYMQLKGDYTASDKKKIIQGLGLAMFDSCEDEDNFRRRPILIDVGLRYNKLFYTFNTSLIEDLLSNPEVNYFLLNYNNIKNFKFKYSIPIYIMINKNLSANSKKREEFSFDLSKLRDYLGIGNVKYARYDNFIARVIMPALIEINEYTDIAIVGSLSTYSREIKLCWKIPYKNRIGIGGIYRKQTTSEYMELKAKKSKNDDLNN